VCWMKNRSDTVWKSISWKELLHRGMQLEVPPAHVVVAVFYSH